MLYGWFIAAAKGSRDMKTFNLYLQSATQAEQLSDVVSFIGSDFSGSFGILAGHARMVTCLKFGLAQIKYVDQHEEFIALPGGVLYFVANKLKIATRHYLRSDNYTEIVTELDKQLAAEETDIANIKESLHRLDENVLQRLWELEREVKHELTR